MSLKKYLVLMAVTTLLCWLCWSYIIFTVNPEITNWIGFCLFYVSLFLSLVGTATLIGFIVRFIALKQALAWRLVKEAFRQSFLFSLLIVVSFILLSKNLFSWVNLGLLVISLSILEFLMLSLTARNS